MPIKYTGAIRVASLLLAFAQVIGVTSALAQSAAPQPPPQTQPLQQTQAQRPSAQIARGELASVDVTTKMLSIKPAEGAEQRFQYTDETKVTGGRGGVAGLATMSGRQVVVRFNTQGANRVATEIEIQAEKTEK